MRNIFIFISFATLLSSCSGDFFDQVVDIDPPEYQKQLVVYAFIGSLDSNFRTQISRNVGLLENVKDSAFYISGAKVELYEDGQLKLTVPQNTLSKAGWYETFTGPGIFTAGKTYELRVTNADFPTASAVQIMPSPVTVDSVRLRENAGIDTDGTKLYSFDVFLRDKAGEKNYYAVSVSSVLFYSVPIFDPSGTMIIGYDTMYMQQRVFPYATDDPNAEVTEEQVLVSDQFFDGQAYKMSFKGSYLQHDVDYSIHVRAITEAQYLYRLSEKRQIASEDFPLAEPVVIHSNVSNGIGLFGLYDEQNFTIRQ